MLLTNPDGLAALVAGGEIQDRIAAALLREKMFSLRLTLRAMTALAASRMTCVER